MANPRITQTTTYTTQLKKKKIGKKFGYLTKIHGHPYILATSEWPVSTWKRAHCLIIREMQSKTTKKYHSGHIRYTLEWLKLDTTPNVSKNKKQTELSSITGSVKWSIHFGERSVPVPWYISNPAILRQWSRIFTFDFYSKWFWWFLPTRKKNVHTDLITFIILHVDIQFSQNHCWRDNLYPIV